MIPKVAIGIPVHNGEKWLAGTVDSILKQRFSDIRVIICDNASTDGTHEIAERLVHSDSRIHYHRNSENIGVFRNMDLTFALSDCPYFKWCAVGDHVHPEFVGRAVDILDSQSDVVLVFSKTRLIGSLAKMQGIQDADISLDSVDPVSRYREYFSQMGLNGSFHGLMRADVLSQTGLNQPFRGSDQCLVAALLLHGRFVRLPEELLYRRIELSTSTATRTLDELDEFFSVDAKSVNKLPTWKFQRQQFVDVLRAPLTARQKLSLLVFLARGLNWKRRDLIREAISFVRPSK